MYVVLQVMFWLFFLVLVYVYGGYPLVLRVLHRVGFRKTHERAEIYPQVSLLIAAHNEENAIRQKMENSLALDYPKHLLEIVVASDCSTDRTDAIVAEYCEMGIVLKRLPMRGGKTLAWNNAAPPSKGEILVFSDATTIYDRRAVRELVSSFADPRVGCVGGRVVYENAHSSGVSFGEGGYSEYEFGIRNLESELGLLTGVSGAIYALRRELFTPLDANLSDDFVVPLNVCQRGYMVVQESNAKATETAVTDTEGLERRRRRMVNRGLRGLWVKRALLNPFRFPRFTFELVSHRLLRWLSPVWLILLLMANVALTFHSLFYGILLALHLGFYVAALLGCWLNDSGRRLPFLEIPSYFVLSNKGILAGTIDFVRGKASATWQPMERQP